MGQRMGHRGHGWVEDDLSLQLLTLIARDSLICSLLIDRRPRGPYGPDEEVPCLPGLNKLLQHPVVGLFLPQAVRTRVEKDLSDGEHAQFR